LGGSKLVNDTETDPADAAVTPVIVHVLPERTIVPVVATLAVVVQVEALVVPHAVPKLTMIFPPS
jgi:hypothetical protein